MELRIYCGRDSARALPRPILSLDGSVVLLRDNAKFGSKAGESEDARVDWEVDDVGVGSSSSGETQESNRLISHATMLNEGEVNGGLG